MVEQMNKCCQITIARYRAEAADEIVHLWRQSKRHALGDYVEPRSYSETLDFLVNFIAKTQHIRLAECNSRGIIVGFMALQGSELKQLYVHVDYLFQGIGSALVNEAKRDSPRGLRLHTFERNISARRFYDRHGFRLVGRDDDNEERLPCLVYEWSPDPGAESAVPSGLGILRV